MECFVIILESGFKLKTIAVSVVDRTDTQLVLQRMVGLLLLRTRHRYVVVVRSRLVRPSLVPEVSMVCGVK